MDGPNPNILFITTAGSDSDGVSIYTETIADTMNEVGCASADIFWFRSGQFTKSNDWLSLFTHCRNEDFDILHFQYGFTDLGLLGPIMLFLLRVLLGVKIVVTAHERVKAKIWYVENAEGVPSWITPFVAPLLSLYDALVNMFAHVVVTHTEQHMSEIMPSSQTTVTKIPHYVDNPTITDAPRANLGQLEAGTVKEFSDRNVLTTFGRVTPKKGYEDVLRALPALENSVYLIAGNPLSSHSEYIKELRVLAADHSVDDRVYFTGYISESEISYLFSVTDLAILPYETVTQSGAMYDALSRECPIVTSDLPPFVSLLSEFSIGAYYKNGDPISLTAAITDASSQTDELKRNITDLKDSHSVESVVDRHCEIYRDIVI